MNCPVCNKPMTDQEDCCWFCTDDEPERTTTIITLEYFEDELDEVLMSLDSDNSDISEIPFFDTEIEE